MLVCTHELVPPLGESQRDSVTQPSGCRVGEATLGTHGQSFPTPTGLRHFVVSADTTPLGLKKNFMSFPRVARASQPWAGGRNPVGIRDNGRRHAARTGIIGSEIARSCKFFTATELTAPAIIHRRFA